MEPDAFYNSGAREVQRARGTEPLADHIAHGYVEEALSETAVDFISKADCFFIATADDQGRPTCSYKGGLPGFVQVVNDVTLRFPDYNGNGMFLSLGNILRNPSVGILFIDFADPARLRIEGDATVLSRPELLDDFVGAEAVVEVHVRRSYENCPRYIHPRGDQEYSKYCPRVDYRPPRPAWKEKPEYEGILPPG